MSDVDRPEPAEPKISTADLARAVDGDAPRETRAFAEAQPQGQSTAQPLFPAEAAGELRSRWDAIQAGFVDEPRQAVEHADGLVAETMKQLAETFAEERQRLEQQWEGGGDVSTEDLRLALQRYRSFFGRLLSV